MKILIVDWISVDLKHINGQAKDETLFTGAASETKSNKTGFLLMPTWD